MASEKAMPISNDVRSVNTVHTDPPPQYYTPQPLYPSPPLPPPQSTNVAYVSNGAVTIVAVGPRMGAKPSSYTCPSCRAVIITKTETKASIMTHFFALGLCMVGCIPCAIIPYYTNSCKNVDHYCPECSAFLGSSYVQ